MSLIMVVALMLSLQLWSLKNVTAAPTPEQRKEMAEIKKEFTKVTTALKKKETEKAETELKAIEEKFDKLVKDAGYTNNDPMVVSTKKLIDIQKNLIQKQKGGPAAAGGMNGQLSFSNDIAPILVDKCLSCHSDNPRAGLRLDSFAAMKRGGRSGLLLVPGEPAQSLLVNRLVITTDARMPKNEDPLPAEEIDKITRWVQQGARFDGASEAASLTDLAKKAMEAKLPAVTVAKPTGKETVSFKEDIAPFMVNICGQCHNDVRKANNFSVGTFESLLRGGDSGTGLVAGEPEKSHLYRMVAGLDKPIMPQGRLLITRTNFKDLRTWIEEGLKFDGPDPKAQLRTLLPDENQQMREKFASMSNDELFKLRLDQSKAKWKKTISSQQPNILERDKFVLLGDVPEIRLKQVAEAAETSLVKLMKSFNDSSPVVWKGKLAIFVFRDRFGYQEFNMSINQREVPEALHAHAIVTDNFQEAYIVVEDIGDVPSSTKPNLDFLVTEQITAAYLLAQSPKLPRWLVEGAGLHLALQELASKEFGIAVNQQAAKAIHNVKRPEQIFEAGSLSPADTGPVGASVVAYLLTLQRSQHLKQFIDALAKGESLDAALGQIYNVTPKAVADYVAGR